MKRKSIILVLFLMMFALTACGDEKPDVSIFMMDNHFDPTQIRDDLQSQLQEKLGEELTVGVSASAMHNLQKLLVEYASKEHGIIILPEDDMKIYGNTGSNLPLDEYFNPKDYPDGVFEGGVFVGDDVVMEEHLYGIPIAEMKIFQDLSYTPVGMYATVPASADETIEQSIAVLKAMME